MKWKEKVKLIKEEKIYLSLEEARQEVPEEDMLIIDMLEKGITEDDELVRQMAVFEEGDEIRARFRLAQFVEDYGAFIEAAEPSRLYE